MLNGAIATLTANTWTEPNGHVAAISDSDSAPTTTSYNALGLRISSKDPDQGTWSFTYDVFGERRYRHPSLERILLMTYCA